MAGRIEYKCDCRSLGRDLDQVGELADRQDLGDLEDLVVLDRQQGLGFRGHQGVPWDHHVRVGLLVHREDQVVL